MMFFGQSSFFREDAFFDFYIDAGMEYIEQARQEVIRRA